MLTVPQLVSSKQLTTFSDFRPRPDDPDFLSAVRYLEYLNEYATHFKLWPYITLKTRVQSITRAYPTKEGSRHIITYTTSMGSEEQWECDAVAVCAGLHVTPNIPDIPGVENIPTRIHSSEFKSREQFGTGKTVLIMGGGETSSDISYLAATSPTKRVLLAHRFGFHLAPKVNWLSQLWPS